MKRALFGILALLLLVLSARVSDAACSVPRTQVSAHGATIGPTCAIQVAIPDQGWTDVDVSRLKLEWSGGEIPFNLSTPARVSVTQGEAFIDPDTCEEYVETWEIPFLVYDLKPEQPLPLDVEIRLLAGDSLLAELTASDASTYCGAVEPVVGMCGSGAPAPVEGCDSPYSPAPPAEELPRSTGCTMAGSGTATPPIAIFIVGGLGLLLRRRRQRPV